MFVYVVTHTDSTVDGTVNVEKCCSTLEKAENYCLNEINLYDPDTRMDQVKVQSGDNWKSYTINEDEEPIVWSIEKMEIE